MTEKKLFTMIDEEFFCQNCGKEVKPLGYTARDHCPYCLYSLHADNNPGDRMANCRGLLKPTGFEKATKDQMKIIYTCDKCGIIKKNKMAKDDNYDLIIELSTKV